MKTGIVLAMAMAMAMAGRLDAASLILGSPGGWNGFLLQGTVKAGFRESGGAGEVSTTDSGFLGVFPDVYPAGTTLTMVSGSSGIPLSVSSSPASGSLKDQASGTLDLSFTIGTATTDDRFEFTVNSTTSAVSALVDFGAGAVPADAFFEASVSLLSYAPALIPGAVLRLPDLPTLDSPATETMFATVNSYLGGSPFAGFMLPGDAGIVLPIELDGAESLDYEFRYSIVTPFGEDPVTSYSLTGSSAVPESATALLLAIGGLAGMRRRRD